MSNKYIFAHPLKLSPHICSSRCIILFMERAVAFAVGHCAGGQLAMMLVGTFSLLILFFPDFDSFWPLLATFGSFLATFGSLLQLLATFSNIWHLLENFTTLGNCWQLLVTFDSFWQLLILATFGNCMQHCNITTLYTDQLDAPAGRTSWTDQQDNQLDRPVLYI